MTREDFKSLQKNQYCDNPKCKCYNKVGLGNIKIHSVKRGQVYCNGCEVKQLFSVTKGTMFYDLRTPIDKVVRCLSLLSSGMGQNAVCRLEQVEGITLRKWLLLASQQTSAFTLYMQQDMQLTQIQIDEFWSFVKKKTQILPKQT